MRQLSAFLLLVLFLSGSFGLRVNAHFCKGVISGISLIQDQFDDNSDCCGPKNDCCSNTQTEVKVDQDFISLDGDVEEENISINAIAFRTISEFQFELNPIVTVLSSTKDPPELWPCPLFKTNCSFLI